MINFLFNPRPNFFSMDVMRRKAGGGRDQPGVVRRSPRKGNKLGRQIISYKFYKLMESSMHIFTAAMYAISAISFVIGSISVYRNIDDVSLLSKAGSAIIIPLGDIRRPISQEFRLDEAGELIANHIMHHCPGSHVRKLFQITADLNYSKHLSALKVYRSLTLDDVNTILGGPISAEEPKSIELCLISLSSLYVGYPDHWRYIEATSGDSFNELTKRFEQESK